MTRRKILFFKLGAIGDVLMTTPLVRQLRKNYPEARMDYLVGKSSSAVLRHNKNIDKVMDFDESTFLKLRIRDYLKLVKDIRKGHYDMIFVLDKHWIFNLASLLAWVKKRIGFRRGIEGIFLTKNISRSMARHEIFYYLDLAKLTGLEPDYSDTGMDFIIAEKDRKTASALLKKKKLDAFIAVANSGGNNPADKNPVRKMPDSLFADILRKITRKNKVAFIGTKDERGYYERFLLNKNCHNLAGLTSLAEAAAIMKKAKLVVTTDSGPIHLAAAVNKRIISIFGPTNPARKAPLHKESTALWKDQEVYDEQYEIDGTIPKGRFFTALKADDIAKLIKEKYKIDV